MANRAPPLTWRAADGSWVCVQCPIAGVPGYLTIVDGMAMHTRFPWPAFDQDWRDEFTKFARVHFQNPPAGWEVTHIAFDHINLQRKTFEPRVDLRRLSQEHSWAPQPINP